MRKKLTTLQYALSALPAEGLHRIQLTPAGPFNAKGQTFELRAADAARMVAEYSGRQSEWAVDYEHQTLNAQSNGKPNPAAGWVKSLEWIEGQGLFALVEWNRLARRLIRENEYRYISPMFRSQGGVITEMLPPALTNFPAIDGMAVVTASTPEAFNEDPKMEELLNALRAALGLSADATPEQITAAFAEHLKKVQSMTTAASAVPDPRKYAPIEALTALQAQVNALSATHTEDKVKGIVASALADGRLLPALEAWAMDLGRKDLTALSTFVAAAVPLSALGAQPQSAAAAGAAGQPTLTETELTVCSQLGLTADEYIASNKGGK